MTIFKFIFISPLNRVASVMKSYIITPPTHRPTPIITQVVEKELLIQEKEKLYMEMKQVLQRQPGPEVAEQLHIYQQSLKEKTKQMKVHRRRPLAHDPCLATNVEHACILCSKCSNRLQVFMYESDLLLTEHGIRTEHV